MDSVCECDWRKIIGKPYAGKLHVRLDEGELEIEPIVCYASSLLYCYRYNVLSRFNLEQHRETCIIPIVTNAIALFMSQSIYLQKKQMLVFS